MLFDDLALGVAWFLGSLGLPLLIGLLLILNHILENR